MSTGFKFGRKTGETGSATLNKVLKSSVSGSAPNSPRKIVPSSSSISTSSTEIPKRTSIKEISSSTNPIEEVSSPPKIKISNKRSLKKEKEENDSGEDEIAQPKKSSRKVSKPTRLIDETTNPDKAEKKIAAKTTRIEVYDSVDIPKRDKVTKELIFPDHPEFRPNMTPFEVLQAGSFGGTYFRPIYSSITGLSYKDQHLEFPSEWYAGLNIPREVTSATYHNNVNKYNVHCGGSLEMWETSGWITSIDPYGWFQWYCRFYLGRRCSDDDRQIARGLGVFGPKGRWRNNLTNKILNSYPTDLQAGLNDYTISPVIRQLLQHWGYELTLKDLETAAKKKK